MDITDRVKLIMTDMGLSSTDFAEKSGIQQSTFSHFINGRNKPSLDVVMKIREACSDINLEWLLYGTGEMRGAIPPVQSGTQDLFGADYSVNNPNIKSEIRTAGLTMESLSALAPILTKQAELEAQKQPEKPPRKITEIRVFFDDNTYEIFHAKN